MNRFQTTLKEYLQEVESIDPMDVLDISIQLLKAIEILHESGRTHNDIKLENLMLETNENNMKAMNVVLIDYGYASRFQSKNGDHIR